jgi:hypothetical protein
MNSCESQQGKRARLGRKYDIETETGQGPRSFEAPGQAFSVP